MNWSALNTRLGKLGIIVGLLWPVVRFIIWLVERAGDVDFIARNKDFIMDVLGMPWFPLVFAIVGIAIVAWGAKRREIPAVQTSHTHQMKQTLKTPDDNQDVVKVYSGSSDDLQIELEILSQRILSPDEVNMLEVLDVLIGAEARVAKIEVAINTEQPTTVSFASLTVGSFKTYPLSFRGAKLQGKMVPNSLYFQLPACLPSGVHNARIGLLVGGVPRWEEWDFQLAV